MQSIVLSGLLRKSLCLMVFAGALAIAAAPHSEAKPKRSQPTCSCTCDIGTQKIDTTYAGLAVCSAYEGKTCNVQTSDGLIRSGTVRNCGRSWRWVDAAATTQGAGTLADPGKQPTTTATTTTGAAITGAKRGN